ncbi:putative beta-galactosidase C [Venturia nashicola]|nr:putative beta-galactosidase C [Venturia nashicola]
MVGMEQLEVHSKSYLVRWIDVSAGNTISWSLQPHKKSLNFGLFKHPGGTTGPPSIPSIQPSDVPSGIEATETTAKKSRNDRSTVVEKLESVGMKSVSWLGKCEADKVTMGSYDVVEGEEGMYGLVFDNSFSKQVSKTVTFVLMTYPSNAPPKSGHHLHFSQGVAANGTKSPALMPEEQLGSPPKDLSLSKSSSAVLVDPRPRSSHITESNSLGGSTFYTGIMNKRKRKHRDYARRFFSLDFESATLSYYRNRNSSALRGSIPLSLAAVSTNEKSREINIDSGAEVWHLKARNQNDFVGWRDALDRASSVVAETPRNKNRDTQNPARPQAVGNPADDREWGQCEALVSKVSGVRDAVRRLAQDTDPKYHPTGSGVTSNNIGTIASPSPSESGSFEFFKEEDSRPPGERMPFWKRKSSSNNQSPAGVFRRTVSSQLVVPMPGGFPGLGQATSTAPRSQHTHGNPTREEGVHDNCMAILRDLDSIVAEFSVLLLDTKCRRQPAISSSRRGSASTVSDDEAEFYDAHEGATSRSSQLLTIRRDSAENGDDNDSVSDGESSGSSVEFEGISSFQRKPREGQNSLFPPKPKNLVPLPLNPVSRRRTVAPAKVPPPSLISFLRKNVGKDLSTIAMPVSSNEPTSALQRVAEQMEYSELLDAAVVCSDANARLLNITAFAISSFSSTRVKERAMRKPFTPLLGETFELVREDKGYRFISEKVSHRPLRMASQAESKDWTFLQAPMPQQKFWGKSAEINTDGRVRIFLHSLNEMYSWTLATSFLRNIIAGEKYVEPVSTMTILNESTGAKAVATFKAGGMFAGRSEEVTVQAFDAHGSLLPTGLAGKWTSHLNFTNQGADTGKQIWKVGTLVDDPVKRYGYTSFAATLNEITAVEEEALPPTDSRLRPDQRLVEEGEIDKAEGLKARLEERQRARRKVDEDHGRSFEPKWFFKAGVEGEDEIWRLKGGKDNYWEARSKRDWNGVLHVFEG